MKITINWTEKTIEFKKIYTREVDRWYNNILMEWVVARASSKDIDIPLCNIQKANDYIVLWMTNLTEEELNAMSSEDFNKVLWEINTIKNGS